MNFVVDVVLIVVAVLVIARSSKKGFVSSVVDTLAMFVSAFASYKIFKPVSQYLYDGFISNMVRTKLLRSIEDSYSLLNFEEKIRRMTEALPENGVRLAKSFGINIESLISSIPQTGDDKQLVATFLEKVAHDAVFFVVEIVVFILLFIIITALVKAIGRGISKILEKLPLVGSFNTLLGGVFGVLKALVVVFVICTALYFVKGSSDDPMIIDSIGFSKIFAFVTEHNPVIGTIL